MERVLFIAYDINPEFGSECGLTHNYLKTYLKHFYVDIYTFSIHMSYLRKFEDDENASLRSIMGMKARERIINEFSSVSLETKLVRLWKNIDQNIIMN